MATMSSHIFTLAAGSSAEETLKWAFSSASKSRSCRLLRLSDSSVEQGRHLRSPRMFNYLFNCDGSHNHGSRHCNSAGKSRSCRLLQSHDAAARQRPSVEVQVQIKRTSQDDQVERKRG